MPSITPISAGALPQVDRPAAADPLSKAAGLSPAARAQLEALNGSRAAEGASFESLLKGFINDVNGRQMAAKEAVHGVLAGEGVPLHQAVIAMEEAGVAFTMLVEVRNRLLESYQEIMRMQI